MRVRVPLPDEPLKAFVGRLKRDNLCATDTELFSRLASYMAIEVEDPAKVNPVLFLAAVYGVDARFFARQHTMLPFSKLVDWFDRDNGESVDFTHDKYLLSVLRSQGKLAYLCPDCVQEDLHFRGISYWRRTHQLAGINWCTKHAVALRRYEGKNAFDVSPVLALRASVKIDSVVDMEANRDHPLVASYARIAESLLTEVGRPYHVADLSIMIREWARQQDLRVALNGKRPLLSDLVARSYPKSWLALNFPGSEKKEAGKFGSWFDSTWFSRKIPSTTSSYVLALALMYESSDDAINALANMSEAVVPRKSEIHRMPGTWATTEIVEVWMKHLGNCSAIAEDLGLSANYVRNRLIEAGLPILGRGAGCAVKRAVQNYWRGDDLATVGESAGANQAHVDSFLRVATERYLATLWGGTQDPT